MKKFLGKEFVLRLAKYLIIFPDYKAKTLILNEKKKDVKFLMAIQELASLRY